MELERCRFEPADLEAYAALFSACFPGAAKLRDLAYLRWLYLENPLGPAVGFNAIADGRLAAHYVCTRARIRFDGRPVPALLSLNTATHPDFQGKGLFTRLAERTYAAGAEEGMALVYGVANANSTPGFLRKLGFSLVEPLESRVGIGPLGRFDWADAGGRARFAQDWTPELLRWRTANPANPVALHHAGDGALALHAFTGRPLLRAWAEIPRPAVLPDLPVRGGAPLRVWLGLMPRGSGRFGLHAQLPERLRPSPLNLIFRDLQGGSVLEAGQSVFSFLDFDAF
jgi:GNAT superfamily N-acetyltransferase